MQTSHRRKTALAALAIVLVPVLSSCGFDYATDRDYTPGVGANDRTGAVDILSAAVVSDEAGQGVLVASLANNDTESTIALDSVSSDTGATFTGVTSVDVAPLGFVNLADGKIAPIKVTGDFRAGNFLSITASFSNGEHVTLKAPVVRNCGYYAETPGLPAGEEHCPSGNDQGNGH